MQQQNDQLEKFIAKILKIKNMDQHTHLTEGDLENIAIEMGFTKTEWDEIKVIYKNHVKLGDGHMQYKNWELAIVSFEQAVALNPYDPDLLFKLASCYAKRWEIKSQNKDKKRALENANKCLQINPGNSGAIALISSLMEVDVIEKSDYKYTFWITVLIVFLSIIAVILFLVYR